MRVPEQMPDRCRVCGGPDGTRSGVGGGTHSGVPAGGRASWVCDRCGWPLGDAPDADLPPVEVSVVYYLRYADRVKIGTSRNARRRLAAIRHDELLALERGDRMREQQRHRQFAALREGGEWFTLTAELTAHIAALCAAAPASDPWRAYDRWLGEAYRARSS